MAGRVYRQGKYKIVTSESTPPFRLQQFPVSSICSCRHCVIAIAATVFITELRELDYMVHTQ